MKKLTVYIYVAILATVVIFSLNCSNLNINKQKKKNRIYVPLHETIGTHHIDSQKIPPSVLKSLYLEFSGFEEIDWQSLNNYFIDIDDTVLNIYQDEEASTYIANFIKDDHFFRVYYSQDGKLISTEETIDFNELPEQVQQSFEAFHSKDMIIGNIRKFIINRDNTYRIKIKDQNKVYILVFNEEGELLHKKKKVSL